MNPQDPLSQLRDIHLPETGGFWPPAPGWWVLALLVLLMIAGMSWLVRRKRQQNRWLRLAKAEMASLEQGATGDPDWFSQLNNLLKRAARQRYPDLHPETLTGEAWVAFLLEKAPSERVASRPVVEAIVHSAWQPRASADPRQAMDFAWRWLGGQKC
ncbi:DUF4381 domain-containing protein [Marinobacter arenosus]|uniref:DUF4381 domain-containing protein n=1 Tax=Marinobacter arenosus TaxID=2856822 RepID=UPI001C4B76AB|nr:DUF4381 domain-containing protein [Marinobacter arenosus]MBW0146717.1 DUF4381 domain-containing protein [Marinobacter arenosus]